MSFNYFDFVKSMDKGELGTAMATIKELCDKITQLEANIADHEARIAELEGV